MSGLACQSCGAANRAERKFCGDCGKPLAANCGSCGFSNMPGEKFCGGCGARLGAAEPVTAPLLPQGERRQVTVLFADIAGYTKLSHELDPEDTHKLLEEFFEIADGAVARFGGRVDKHIGDNVMAVFGAPVAHDDDPARAVRASVEIHERVEKLKTPSQNPIGVHIGIATGEVIASALGSKHHQEYGVIGDAVNLAARLQDKAASGETVVTELVRNATAQLASYSSLGEVSLKGFKAPFHLWKFQELSSRESEGVERPFVGREAELGQLTALLQRAIDSGRGGAALLRGEPGMGKTRLMREARKAAEQLGFESHRTLILDFGRGAGQGPMGALAASLLQLSERATAAERRAAVERAVNEAVIGAESSHVLAGLLDCPLTEDEARVHAAMGLAAMDTAEASCLAALVRARARQTPVFVGVEDAHWADASTLRLTGAIVEAAAFVPLVTVVTARPEGDPLAPAKRDLIARGPIEAIDLSALSASESMRLALASGVSSDAARACIARSGGNPLFLEQLIETAPGADEGLPPTLQSVVLARVDRLAAKDRAALQAASVVGQRFDPELVRSLLGAADYPFDQLIAQRLIRHDGDALLFQHVLIQQGIYGSLTRARRRELHLHLATHPATDVVQKAQHLDRAQDAGAGRMYLLAAELQSSKHLLHSALSLAERALELSPERPLKHALEMKRAGILQAMGRNRDAAPAYEAALAAASGDREQCAAWLGIASSHRMASNYSAVPAALDAAEPIARALGDDEMLSAIHYHRGGVAFVTGQPDECLAQYQLSLEHAERSGNAERIARALSGLGDATYASGQFVESEGFFERCLATAEAGGVERVRPVNLGMLATVKTMLGEFDEAERLLELGKTAAARLGDDRAGFFVEVGGVLLRAYQAPPEEAVRFTSECLEGAMKRGLNLYVGEMRALCTEFLTELGRREEALKMARLAVEHDRSFHSLTLAPSLVYLATVVQDPKEAAELIEEGRRALPRTIYFARCMFYRALIECGVQGRNIALIEEGVRELKAAKPSEKVAWFHFTIRRGEVLIEFLRGRRDETLRDAIRRLLEEMPARKYYLGAGALREALALVEQSAA